jgi:hypothetical protein
LLTGFDSTVAVGFEGVAAGFEAGLAATAVGVREDLDADFVTCLRGMGPILATKGVSVQIA